MLRHLHIQNYALISQLDIDFGAGFSVLTGETGAGKSIILGALHLVMGGKADVKTITEGESLCVIEATFDVEKDGKTEELLIRRELYSTGRSRSFINDSIASQAELKQWAAQLIDIHSQHQSLLLGEQNFQLQIVDAIAFGNDLTIIEKYQSIYEEYTEETRVLNELKTFATKARQDADYIQFQWKQLDEANLQPGEMAQLEEEQYQLSNVEEIQGTLQEALQVLDNEEMGVVHALHRISIEKASSELAERLKSVEIELKDILQEIHNQDEQTEANPERLQQVEERISLLNGLMKKHQTEDVDALIVLRDELGKQCQRIDNFDEEIKEHESRLSEITLRLQKAAQELHTRRQKVLPAIHKNLIESLTRLGIKHAKVEIKLTQSKDYTSTGNDSVQFLFAANLNQSLRTLTDVASGGELSRVLLSVKAMIAATNGLPTIIFDEIDAGVSGPVATEMGHIMQQIAQVRQIIAITHLPQIAALAPNHYRVYKKDTDQRTETHIQRLTNEERLTELAQLLSGSAPTKESLSVAKSMLEASGTPKYPEG